MALFQNSKHIFRAKVLHHHRYGFLDALRGVAALCVGVLHATQAFQLGIKPIHASLAVDFFFCLSGFVIAYAYETRLIQGMAVNSFFVRRLIRLYPMILVSIALGGVLLLLVPSFTLSKAFFLLISGLFLIPSGLVFGLQAYPVNNPIWSLFFEIFINYMYAKFWVNLSKTKSYITLLIFATALVIVVAISSGIDPIGFSSPRSFLFGFVRVGYPFFAGVMIYRFALKHILKIRVHYSIPGILILAMLLNLDFNGVIQYDLICAILVIPLIVAVGASVSTSSVKANKFFDWLGSISYPFYLIHSPILRLFRQATEGRQLFSGFEIYISLVSLAVAIGASSVLLHIYDIPVRNWLSSKIRSFNTNEI